MSLQPWSSDKIDPAALVAVLLIGVLIGGGLGFIFSSLLFCPRPEPCPPVPVAALTPPSSATEEAPTASPPQGPPVVTPTVVAEPSPTPVPPTPTPPPPFFEGPLTYGHSVQGRPLVAYRLGSGPSARAIIGGIHGGYEWNTVEFVSDTLTYLRENPELIPPDVTLYLIPNMNPDGYVAGRDAITGRPNANDVDLNRNWDYEWQPVASHGTRPVSGGTEAFSEPETAHTRDFILEHDLEAVIFYHSAMGVVFSGADRESSATFELTELLSQATGYPHQTEGMPGQITTGDAIDWLSVEGIAGTEIELTTHDRIGEAERERNRSGILAFLNWDAPGAGEVVEGNGWIDYTVQPGETLSGIAFEHDILPGTPAYQELLSINDIEDEDSIVAGDVIRIPVSTGGE